MGMRSRNIKPGFFKNDSLAECSPMARLLFAGLWCLADRDGRLEYRERRIKAEVLPYDDVDVVALVQELVEHGFLLQYEANANNLLQVVNWSKHQSPHYKEPDSELPPPQQNAHPIENNTQNRALTNHGPSIDQSLINHGSSMNPALINHGSSMDPALINHDPLIPDSGFLIPDSKPSGCQSAATKKKKHLNGRLPPETVERLRGLDRKLSELSAGKFEFWPLVQQAVNDNRHPGAICDALESVADSWGGIEKPFAYARAAIRSRSQNYHGREHEAQAAALKKAVVSGELRKLLAGIGDGPADLKEVSK